MDLNSKKAILIMLRSKEPSDGWKQCGWYGERYEWGFKCMPSKYCEDCNLKFRCLTSSKTVMITNRKLVRKINNAVEWFGYTKAQIEAKRIFFEEINKCSS